MNADWQTSSYSNGTCVEARRTGDGIEVRDTKDRDGGTLRFDEVEWKAFVAGVKDGEFD